MVFAVPPTTVVGQLAAAVPAAFTQEAAGGVPVATQLVGGVAILKRVMIVFTDTHCSRRLSSAHPSPTALFVMFPEFSKVVESSYD